MKIFWSAETGGFYFQGVNASIPAGAVEISAAEHRALLDAQAAGARILSDAGGIPYAQMPATPTLAEQRGAKVLAVKAEAERRILDIAPLWRQSNDAAAIALRALELANLGHSSVDATEAAARRAKIDAIREASNQIEEHVSGMTAAELEAFDIAAAPDWPAFQEQ